jgi:IS30 family transposase
MSGLTQLPQEQRYQIVAPVKSGRRQKDSGAILGVDKSTISRKSRRNRGQRGYRPQQAHRPALERRINKVRRRIDDHVWSQVEVLLREEWSAEHEWIYQYVCWDKRSAAIHFAAYAVRRFVAGTSQRIAVEASRPVPRQPFTR